MHPRISVSAICTFPWTLDEDLELWAADGITNVGVSVAKLERAGWNDGVARVEAAGLRVVNLIGLGPFHLADPEQWPRQRERVDHALDAADRLHAECLVFTTGPAGPLAWEDAADALERALAPMVDEAHARDLSLAIEHTNPMRVDVGFVHTLRDDIDLARRLGTGVCMEINACWAERDLGATIRDGVDALRLVQVSDFAVGTLSTPNRLVPGDGEIPLERIIGDVLDADYAGCFDLELIGPRIDDEGYSSAIHRSVEWLTELLDRLGA
ncbi:MAG: sugar phosphate isomerase/epimerase family protein [Acidimicrobiia bacterium]